MKYVLMYSSRPDLDAAVPEERRMEVYGQIFQWFETHASVFVDAGAELQGPATATTVRAGTNGSPVVVDGPYSEAKEVDRRVQRHRRPGPRRRARAGAVLAVARVPRDRRRGASDRRARMD